MDNRADLHNIQMLILRELLFHPNSRFSDLNIDGLSNDHFSYHINTLIELGYVKKESGKYSLTTEGKEYSNRMDTDDHSIEKQPKIAVMIVATKNINGIKHLLIQQRTKEPYFGYSGFITGKIRFGEKVAKTARRELMEETGLDCTKVNIKKIVHDHVVLQESGKLVEDKMFFIVHVPNPKGDIKDTECGINRWLTEKEFYNLKKKYYDEENIYAISKLRKNLDLDESTYFINKF